MRPISLKAF